MNIIEQASSIPTLTDQNERELLSKLASNLDNLFPRLVVEIGCLYGGMTAVLAMSTDAKVIAIDNFSWHPQGFPKTSKQLVETYMKELDIDNVEVIEGDSRIIGRKWNKEIDLLWIDGGHSFKFVYSDLYLFGPLAQVIALHDYDNPAWPSVRQAVETFIGKFPYWYIDEIVGLVCVLRRR